MGLLELLIIILLLSWFGGFALNVGGDLIHILLLVVLVVVIVRIARGQRPL